MDLVPYIYWEKQEEGSQLCAQHCLNTILQQFAYTEFDLAEIAQNLDQAENAALGPSHQNKKSYNLDDTGFFSVSVLERALQVWDLTLVRWRGEAMKPYQEHPEEQAAFILNLASHWLPLRRFSPHHPSKSPSSSGNRWYNLNSFLPNGPEWISATYLRLVLTQAEKEGYSVFVIRKAGTAGAMGDDGLVNEDGEGVGWGDGGVGVLPESQADRMAVELGEPTGRSGTGSVTGGASTGPSGSGSGSRSYNPDVPTVDPSSPGPSTFSAPNETSISLIAGSGRRRRRQGDLTSTQVPAEADIFDDNQFSNPAHAADPEDASSEFPHTPQSRNQADLNDDDDDEEHVDDDGDSDLPTLGRPIGGGRHRPTETGEDSGYEGPLDFAFQSRSYDDEDAELQAALKASMADVPAGWVAPVLEPKDKVIKKTPTATPSTQVDKAMSRDAKAILPSVQSQKQLVQEPDSNSSTGAGGSKFKEEIEEDEDLPTEVLTPAEIRRRRLAKFQ